MDEGVKILVAEMPAAFAMDAPITIQQIWNGTYTVRAHGIDLTTTTEKLLSQQMVPQCHVFFIRRRAHQAHKGIS